MLNVRVVSTFTLSGNDTARSMTAGEEVTLSLASAGSGDGIIGFEGHGAGGERQTTTRLLDGEFPKVRHIMNTTALMNVRVSTADAIAAAKRVALVAERNTSLRMLIGDGVVTLEAATGDQAQGSEAIEAQIDQPGGGDADQLRQPDEADPRGGGGKIGGPLVVIAGAMLSRPGSICRASRPRRAAKACHPGRRTEGVPCNGGAGPPVSGVLPLPAAPPVPKMHRGKARKRACGDAL